VDFIRARTEEQVSIRQEEIISACDALYACAGYEGVTIKAIAERTSLKRPTIYVYYKTKEEILLDLLKREMLDWQASMEAAFNAAETMSREEYAALFSDMLASHDKMLRLFCILTTIIENQCGIEKLTEFKRETAGCFSIIQASLDKFFPAASQSGKEFFMFSFLASLLGMYPLANPTEKQQTAMKNAGREWTPPGF
jgi:AcrR family transcriptional regulator